MEHNLEIRFDNMTAHINVLYQDIEKLFTLIEELEIALENKFKKEDEFKPGLAHGVIKDLSD